MSAPYYQPGSGLGLQNLGQDATPAVPATTPTLQPVTSPLYGPGMMLFWVVDALSVALSAFHGYRRHNGSVGAAIGWGVLGGLFPILTPAIAFAEGFGQPLPVKSNKKKRRFKARRRMRR